MDPAVATAGSNFAGGRHQKNGTKFVFRGGFKIPRDLTPMPSVDSFGGAAAAPSSTCGEIGAATSNGSVIVNGESWHNINSAFDAEAPQDINGGGSATTQRNRGSNREADSNVSQRLDGIISSSRIRIGNGSKREGADCGRGGGSGKGGGNGGAAGTSGREGEKKPRPRTAGATVGQRDCSLLGATGGAQSATPRHQTPG